MSFAINEIVRDPKVLTRLRAEVDANIPFDVEIPSLSQIKLPYLIMILKETMRLRFSGFGTFRECLVDTEISGVTFPANITFALWNPAVHRDPRLWDNPDTFDPERWLLGKSHIRGSYFPFSYGPRNCIGQGLAMFKMTITLATLFRRYDFTF
ncbi:hypothetical protein EG329_009100 [Mollisiaceae sp. DMI_Dod_QoI]|nr:hypothetical protein EG329_009100 [Helotiales sp. DMI_Dod_QoI]